MMWSSDGRLRLYPADSWWRIAIYPFGYPTNPAEIPDAPLCPTCRARYVVPRWRPALAVVAYTTDVGASESCVKCGRSRRQPCHAGVGHLDDAEDRGCAGWLCSACWIWLRERCATT